MKIKDQKFVNIIGNIHYLLALILFLLLFSCSKDRDNWEGIWRTEIEYIPGLQSTYELGICQGFFSREWSGRYEAEELFSSGEILEIKVDRLKIEIDFGVVGYFKGQLSEDKGILEGIFYGSNGSNEDMKFVKVDEWTSERPARTDENGNTTKHWSYKIPESIGDGWSVSNLQIAKNSQGLINELFQKVLNGHYKGLDAVLITHEGRLVLEEYFHLGAQDRIHALNSCTKSVTSLLVGIAYDNGLITNLEEPIFSYFTDFKDTIETKTWPISLKHVLTMSAGLDWNEEDIPYPNPKNDLVRMEQSADMYHFVLKRQITPGNRPGNKFNYNSGLSVLLGGVLHHATGISVEKYAEMTLFNKLGIEQYTWQSVTDKIHTGGGLLLRPRDFLKVGQLVLDNGKWNGEQIISESWIKESTSFHLPVKESYELGYGYQWWRTVFHIEGTEYSSIYASGFGGQFLFIIPDLDLVVLFLHHNPNDLALDHTMAWKELSEYIIPTFSDN